MQQEPLGDATGVTEGSWVDAKAVDMALLARERRRVEHDQANNVSSFFCIMQRGFENNSDELYMYLSNWGLRSQLGAKVSITIHS
jgi:hypothetical protein